MAFSGSSYFAGIGTALAAIAFGVACGSMVTTSVVRPPNRLERLNSGTTVGSNSGPTHQAAPTVAEKSDPTKPPAQDAPAAAIAATAAVPGSDPHPAEQPQPAVPAAVKSGMATSGPPRPAPASVTSQPSNARPAPVAKSEDAASANDDTAAAKTGRANTRSPGSSREISRRRTQPRSSDDQRISERKRRQDEDGRQQNLDAAVDVVRQMPRGNAAGEAVVERDDSPRIARPRHFETFDDDGPPQRPDGPPPAFGFFGFGD